MAEIEVRLPCSTCLGVTMEKLKPVKDANLVLDYCRRCGGVWFDAGEVAMLRKLRPKGIGRTIELRESAFRMPCHSCHAPMDPGKTSCHVPRARNLSSAWSVMA
jgi:Zn-finger nucleic acid-binding protein